MPHATQMSAADTGLLVIDVQEKLLPLIPDARAVVRNAAFLIDAARLLEMTVQATAQYPRGLVPRGPAPPPSACGLACCWAPAPATRTLTSCGRWPRRSWATSPRSSCAYWTRSRTCSALSS